MSTLSVITVAKDEERNIAACLESVAWAHERIVVDTGSIDRTGEIARAMTERVLTLPWRGYGGTKNDALIHAHGEWVLWLDADERVTPELAAEIRQVLAGPVTDVSAYAMPRRAWFLGRWMMHGGWYPSPVTRLFRRGTARFTERSVHEELVVDGRTEMLRGDLLHYTDPDLHHYFTKFNRYTTLAAEDLDAAGRRWSLTGQLLRPAYQFARMYFFRRGFLDGVQGLILAVVSSAYVFVKYAKLWERRHGTPAPEK